ncbi:MAG: hypothetical protein A3B78_01435 [Omnitrophica WOR_2 bacterium RIFCSPHIGHO2_02_FULL_67_20]|nr:MAG: hypothetical protein A3B78_01435 [Omnitrophica WOR_2 bacterium RIFCSPHIGHO2_02_FULL_67_20]
MQSGWKFVGLSLVGMTISLAILRTAGSAQFAAIVSLGAIVCGMIGTVLLVQDQMAAGESSLTNPVIGVLVTVGNFFPLNWALKAAGIPLVIFPR